MCCTKESHMGSEGHEGTEMKTELTSSKACFVSDNVLETLHQSFVHAHALVSAGMLAVGPA